MSKNILFFADGTWNGPGQDDDTDDTCCTTNVFKLFGLLRGTDDVASIRLKNEQERSLTEQGQLRQVAKYLHGVGDSENWLKKVLGGVFGAGVIARIARGYTFVSRHYEPGDRIVLVGFSRGAYTVRALGGLIGSQGLLDRTKVNCEDRDESYRLACAAWKRYRGQRASPSGAERLLTLLRDLPAFFQDDSVEGKLTPPVDIQCIAVWDTVGALGIPLYRSRDERLDAFQFCDRALGTRVKRGLHAVSIDEQRVDFTPTLWDKRDGVRQVLFAGAHADIGGGYPMSGGESDLAHLSLQWMHDRLAEEEVLFDDTDVAVRYAGSCHGGSHQPWLKVPWIGMPRGDRSFAQAQALGLEIHPSVLERCGATGPFALYPGGELGKYAPGNLPTA